MPYHSYETVADAVTNAKRLVAAGAEAVKAEGGRDILAQVRAIVAQGIPFLGHLGMLPQHVLEEGGYHVKGKKDSEQQALLADADALVRAGAFAIVLELVTPPVAADLTRRIPIPTIGIGSGPDCDGQILVTPDLLGMLPWYSLKHVKPKLNAAEQMKKVVKEWKNAISIGPRKNETSMKPLLCALSLFVFSYFIRPAVQAQVLAPNQVPPAVRQGMQEKFPAMKRTEWKLKPDKNYEAEFTLKGTEIAAKFDPAGKWLETETSIPRSEIPKAVRHAAAKAFKDYKVIERQSVQRPDKPSLIYELHLENSTEIIKAQFTDDGSLLNHAAKPKHAILRTTAPENRK
jgi:hypothetical protein